MLSTIMLICHDLSSGLNVNLVLSAAIQQFTRRFRLKVNGSTWISRRSRIVFFLSKYSRIPLSRAPLTRENQLVALAPWTPNFSEAPLAIARMTDR